MEQHTPGLLYLGTNGHAVCLDVASGAEVWRTFLDTGAAFFASTTAEEVTILEAGDTLLAGCCGHVFALNKADGSILWHNSLEELGHHPVSLAGFGQAIQYVQRTVRRG